MASKSSKRRRKQRRRKEHPPGERQDAGERRSSGEPQQPGSATRPPRRRRNVDDEAPPAPWGSFPLVELTVLVGIVMLVLGFLFIGGERGTILIITGLLLGSIGGLEISIREHFAGYRSHTVVLAGLPAAAVLGLLFYAGPDGLPALARAAIGLAVFAAVAWLLTRVFQRRSGGHSFRFSGLRRR